MKKKRILSLLAIASLILSIPFLAGAVDLAARERQTAQQNANPYVQQYLKERGTDADENSLSNNSEQRALDMQALVEIYHDDVEAGSILEKYLSSTYSVRATDLAAEASSLDRKQVVDTMHRIESVYDSANEEEQELFLSYLLHHARACEDPQSIAFLESLNNTDPIQLAANYTYSGTAAKNYAHTWYNGFNPAYPNMSNFGGVGNSGDCTNFVSQCMKAGGIPFQDNWYCYKLNNYFQAPTSPYELNTSWQLSDPSPWTAIKQFTLYWYSRISVYQYSKQAYQQRHAEIYNMDIQLGDIVILCGGVSGAVTWGEHAMIVTAYDTANKDFKLSGHTNPRKDYPLLTILSTQYSAVDFYRF